MCRKRFTIFGRSTVLEKKKYMEERYDKYISDSYRAMERTNFYDAIYLTGYSDSECRCAVAVVMLLSASGNQQILTFLECLPEQQ